MRYDGSETANIEVSYDYWNATCGLCGTFDDDKTNEFRLQDGSLVSRASYNEYTKLHEKFDYLFPSKETSLKIIIDPIINHL